MTSALISVCLGMAVVAGIWSDQPMFKGIASMIVVINMVMKIYANFLSIEET